jgi:hypothetical protein
MKQSTFTEEQMITILRQAAFGLAKSQTAAELTGLGTTTVAQWGSRSRNPCQFRP